MEWAFQTGNLVYLAMLAAFAGFVLTDQLLLRSLVLLSSALYISYYYVHTPVPQWSAIVSSAVVASANVYGLVQLIMNRMTVFFTAEQRCLYAMMPGLEPGDFRQLMRVGSLEKRPEARALTHEDQPVETVHFLFEGAANVEKAGSSFSLIGPSFIGEVSFLLDVNASASCTARPNALLVSWDAGKLRALLDRKPRLRQALEAQVARDMARKVAAGIGISTPSRAAPPKALA